VEPSRNKKPILTPEPTMLPVEVMAPLLRVPVVEMVPLPKERAPLSVEMVPPLVTRLPEASILQMPFNRVSLEPMMTWPVPLGRREIFPLEVVQDSALRVELSNNN